MPALCACTHRSAMHDAVYYSIESGECHEAAAWALENRDKKSNTSAEAPASSSESRVDCAGHNAGSLHADVSESETGDGNSSNRDQDLCMAREERIKAVLAYTRASVYSCAPGAVVCRQYRSFALECLGLALRRMGMYMYVYVCVYAWG